jgi:WD40 repeat protein
MLSVRAVAFSPDGTRVLTGSRDNTARLWDAATGAAVAILAGHTDAVRAVAFSPDGKRVLTDSSDSTARLWDAFSSSQDVVDEVKASMLRCLTPEERASRHTCTRGFEVATHCAGSRSPRWED